MEEGTGDMLSMSIEGFGYDIREKNLGCASIKGMFWCDRHTCL